MDAIVYYDAKVVAIHDKFPKAHSCFLICVHLCTRMFVRAVSLNSIVSCSNVMLYCNEGVKQLAEAAKSCIQ